MPQIMLKVPYVTQLGFGDPSNLKDDPSGCWYAMACMIASFFEQGPRLGLPELYQYGYGVDSNGRSTFGHRALHPGTSQEAQFMQNEELERVPVPESRKWNVENLAMLLRKYGPIGFYRIKTLGGKTYGHASVLIGVDGRTVMFHDPENGPRSTFSLLEFNETLWWEIPNVMVRRKGSAFQATPNLTTFKPMVIKPKPAMESNLSG
jgi:hypothetical protein